MTKKDLMNGDIVVLRSGLVGVVIINKNASYLLFQNEGWEDLDCDYSDDMVYLYPNSDEEPDAIMQVYRSKCGISFMDYSDEDPIFERDNEWTKPTKRKWMQRLLQKRIKTSHK